MKFIVRLIYNLGIYSYVAIIYLGALFKPKARKWISGRRNIFLLIQNSVRANEKIVWVHCASLGEFEQGRPLIERLKKDIPGIKILLTFFSPSGYEIRKNYALADHVFYLPIDTRRHARKFVDLVHPSLVIFVKYEFWYHYLTELHRQHIRVLLISAAFREDQLFFKWYGRFFPLLEYYDYLFVQNKFSQTLVNRAGIFDVTVTGDTRFDRVISVAANAPHFPLIEKYLDGQKAFIAGSTWPADEQLIAEYYLQQHPSFPLIIAPHEIDEKHLHNIRELFSGNTIRYSELSNNKVAKGKVLIIDNIGMLAALYQYAFVAWIGGGFNSGIHNILEAAVFGAPVMFGPKYHKYVEAVNLIKNKGAFCVKNSTELKKQMDKMQQADYLSAVAAAASTFVNQNKGATDQIMKYIQEKRFLTMA